MSVKSWIAAAALAGVFAVSSAGACLADGGGSGGVAKASDPIVDLGPSNEDFTLYGQGALTPGIGSFTVGQGAGAYDSATDTSTFTLSGAITGGSPGFDSGTYEFVTTYAGLDVPQGGPNAPGAVSDASNTDYFLYDYLDPSTTMTLDLFGTPTGNHVIPIVAGGAFLGPTFSFSYTSAMCTGVSLPCDQNTVGLTPGATYYGPVDITVTFDATSPGGVPEPSTWAMMLLGFAGLGYAGYRRSRPAGAVA